MRVIVTGGSGFIGRACLRAMREHACLGTSFSNRHADLREVDLRSMEAVAELVSAFRPDAIVHCAARPSVDWCEENPDEARRLNVEASLNVLAAAEMVGARMAFLSTDYVFDGKAGPYAEEASVNPINRYGEYKLEVESALLSSARPHLVVRTTNVFGYDPKSKNFLMALLPRLASGQVAEVADDQLGTPTHVDDLCAAIQALLETEVGGVIHVAGPDLVDRVQWLGAAARTFGLDPALVRGRKTSTLGQPAPRPLRAGLKSERLRGLGLRAPRSLEDGLAWMKHEKQTAAVQTW